MATIKQRISLEGSDEVLKALEKLGKTGEEAFRQTQDAAEKTAPALEKAGQAAEATGEGLEKIGQQGEKAAEAITAVGTASQQVSTNVAGSGDAAEKSSGSFAELGLAVVRTGAAVVQAGAGLAGASAAVAQTGLMATTAVASVGTFALTLGTTLVGGIGAAVAALGVLGTALERIAFSDARLSDTIEHLARNTRAIGQGFRELQVGQAAFQQIGISAEKFRSVIAKIKEELTGLDVGVIIQKSADEIDSATNKLLEAEKKLFEAKLKNVPEGTFAAFDIQNRIKALEELKVVESDVAKAEKEFAAARNEAAIAEANELGKNVNLMKQLAAGLPNRFGVTDFEIDSLVTAKTKLVAVKAALQDVNEAGGDVGKTFLNIIANLPKADAFKIGKDFGLSETDVDRVRRYGAELIKIDGLYARINAQGVLIDPATAQTFDDLAAAQQRLASAQARFAQAWDSTIFSRFAAGAAAAFANIQARIVEFGAQILETFNMLGAQLMTTLGQIGSGWASIFSMIGQGLAIIGQGIVKLVTTAVGGAWQWIVDRFNAAVAWVSSTASSVAASIVAFVTQAPGAAWQWIVDTFNSAMTNLGSAISAAVASIVAFVTSPVANAWQWIVVAWNAMLEKIGIGGGGAAAPAGGGIPGAASGGLLGGRGTGTSDSNLAWVSRGEHIMPARAVSQPGVLAFLEALRRSGGNLRDVLDGMGRFALGGLVRAPIAIPAFAGGGMNAVTINFPGLPEITGLRASSGVVDELRKAAAMAQVRSGGRKPSRYS